MKLIWDNNKDTMYDYELASVFTWVYLTPLTVASRLEENYWYSINYDMDLPKIAELLNCIKNSTGVRFEGSDTLDA